jgi:hypothetical protein
MRVEFISLDVETPISARGACPTATAMRAEFVLLDVET